MRDGVVDTLNYFGIGVQVKREQNLVVPAFRRAIRFDYAQPVMGVIELLLPIVSLRLVLPSVISLSSLSQLPWPLTCRLRY